MKKVAIEHADNYRLDSIKTTLRSCFDDLGFPAKNPLSAIVKPGDRVFIKPNWVASRWRASCPHKDTLYCVITHPSVIEAIADYVAEALNGKGEIIIGDNPSIDADFAELMEFTEIERIKDKYNIPVSISETEVPTPLRCRAMIEGTTGRGFIRLNKCHTIVMPMQGQQGMNMDGRSVSSS